MSIRTPLRQHEKSHRRPDLEMGDCWECQRERAKCRVKRRFPDGATAAEVAQAENVSSEWRLMLAPYACPWCCAYHLTRAKPGTSRWKRVEKRRRKWLVSEAS